MLPHLPQQTPPTGETDAFLTALTRTPFSGETRADFASRLLTATDNSIYQILPQAVLFPKTTEDVAQIFRLANQPPFQTLKFSPRGGGTGTNGQSLSPGIIIDCSKFMTQILDVNLAENSVTVQPGVILDQLNTRLKQHNRFFAPNLSPSSRATLGGMINTDACGKGSRIYGRTSDHILELTWVLPDGTIATSKSVLADHVSSLKSQPDPVGKIYHLIDKIVTTKRNLIEQQFPNMPRFLTGYNLAKVYDSNYTTFDLNRILAGSEGTLAVITEAKLKLTPRPSAKALCVIHYNSFDDALSDSEHLLTLQPAAIETIDETILELAKQDEIYTRVSGFVAAAKAINLVEFVGENETQLNDKIKQIEQQLTDHRAVGYYRAKITEEIQDLWTLRKKGVGLLGNRKGPRKPIPFMEDTAVPPAQLSKYVRALKTLLNSYSLDYAMFGHVDVGCLHVRPALNMQTPQDERLIREISDQVVDLVRDHGGVMWAEHGRGFRSEYTPLFFGEELYEDLRRIKAAFDPHNRLNPGKIVTPAGSEETVVKIEAPLRGHFDRQVPAAEQKNYEVAFSCNGNGACFNIDPTQVMCPSYKGSKERIHSPKGRATLLKEWLRQIAERGSCSESESVDEPASLPIKMWNSLTKAAGRYDYSHEVYDGLHGCLACKACASQCPIHVDIPSLKSKFLQRYYTRYLRSPRDYLMGNIEAIAPLQSKFPTLSNTLLQNPLSAQLIQQLFGLTRPPKLSTPSLTQTLNNRNLPTLDLNPLNQADLTNSVILLPDAFTSAYEAPLVLATYDLFTQLGFQVYLPPPLKSGKPLHVLGFVERFNAIAQQNIEYLSQLRSLNLPIIGIEPSLTLTYRDEYASITNQPPNVQLPQEFLLNHLDRVPKVADARTYQLFGHCHEKAIAPSSQQQWQQIFAAADLSLTLIETGCCGMAGLYGYQAEHLETSRSIYQLSWEAHLPDAAHMQKTVLATGLSCRSQVERFSHWRPLHPLQALQQALAQHPNNQRSPSIR
ncbi:MAG: FAD-binding and (Fe-S)-binding domain-containing protein [Cyanobacteria bacterium J06560_6]